MRATLSKFGVVLFFALLAFVFSPLGGVGPMDVSASEVDQGVKEGIQQGQKGQMNKEDIKLLEDEVRIKRGDVEKKLEARLGELFKDEEILNDLAELQELEEELAANGEDTWLVKPFAPRPFFVRPPAFFPRVFNPFLVRPFFFFDDDPFFIGQRFFGEEAD